MSVSFFLKSNITFGDIEAEDREGYGNSQNGDNVLHIVRGSSEVLLNLIPLSGSGLGFTS